ncbi:LOW QUALITY PROTEIN: probable flap endonuclease 1 homolog [Pristis pectinata]|uniref:LOW QUALITY PROTEIN: probable flap endonuclease 1 homolog n=1 Tax=Pristis pectinata TaxID=685728 RepID=UPI00223E312B|nr:LOW QUALITY PROTEIN: probable flap endonuclease 1 homolog [Pristis pectinata]
MGISRLSELIRERAAEAVTSKTIHAYEGRVMALDAAVVMNQFAWLGHDRRYLHHLSQIVGVFYRTASLLEKGIKPVFVFDGPAPRMKSRVLRKRHGWRPVPQSEEHACGPVPQSEEHACGPVPQSEEHACTQVPERQEHVCRPVLDSEEHAWRPVPESEGHACGPIPDSQELRCKGMEEASPEDWGAEDGASLEEGISKRPRGREQSRGQSKDQNPTAGQTERVERTGRRDCQRLLTLLGVPFIEAPGEAEATCAALVKAGKVHCTATEDMDALPFGCTRLVRNVSARRDARVEEFSLPDILKALKLTQEQFVDLCILMGCDYCEKIKGVGVKRVLPLIQAHKTIEGVVQNLDRLKFPAPDDWPFQEARSLFLQPEVVDPQEVVLEWGEPDEEGLVQLLVHEKKAKEKRVRSRIRSLRESLRDVERRSRMFTSEQQRRLDDFYCRVKGLRYRRQGDQPHFQLSKKKRRTAHRNLSRLPLRRRLAAPPRDPLPGTRSPAPSLPSSGATEPYGAPATGLTPAVGPLPRAPPSLPPPPPSPGALAMGGGYPRPEVGPSLGWDLVLPVPVE